jgi:AbrB family looped-hinge helix DNA binding protein
MAQAKVDDKGRIAIPASLRRQVGMREGDKVTIDRDGSKLVIVIEPPVIRTVNSRGGWKKDPFPSTGEALFGS